jgi:tetratricopeptide (TPR) repeat protein
MIPERQRAWLVAGLLALVALAAHWPVLANDFVPFDDPGCFLAVPEVMGGLSWQGVAWAFTSLDLSNYFPVTRLSWMIDAELFGRDPAGFHATSLALHVANVALLFLALSRLTREIWPSAFVAAVFAVHPLHVESIAWVSTRKDVLAGFFFGVALLAHERRARGANPLAWSCLLAAALALGLLSKPVLVTLPFVLLLLDVWPLERWRRGELRGLFREKAVLFALVLASAVLTLAAQQRAMASLDVFPIGQRIANAAIAYLDYAERAVWPRELAVLYPFPRDAGARFIAALALLTAATGLALRYRERPWYFVGLAWFLGTLVPSIGLIQVGAQASADRYTYLSLAGLSIVAAFGTRDALAALPDSRRRLAAFAAGGVALVWLAFLAGATREQIATWKDGRTLFEHALAVTRDNVGAEYRLALILHHEGQVQAALPHFEKALELEPTNAEIRDALERARRDARR